jgi:hypothetical protein
MKDGYVRGALSESTMLFLASNKIVEVARNFMSLKADPVFRTNVWDSSKNEFVISIDSTRKMRIINSMEEFNGVPELKEAFQLIIEDVKKHPMFTEGGKKNKLVCKLNVDMATISIMVDGKVNQQEHTDYSREEIMRQFYGEACTNEDRQYMPIVLFIALENNTRLGYYPNSHNFVMDNKQYSINAAQYMLFNAGEFVIFHPLFVHFGCAYGVRSDKGHWQQEHNIRVHFYVEAGTCARAVNSATGIPDTYPVLLKEDNTIKIWTAKQRMLHARTTAKRKNKAVMVHIKKARKVALLKRMEFAANASIANAECISDEASVLRRSKRIKITS